MKDAGVGIKSRQQYEGGDAMNQVLPRVAVGAAAFRLGAISLSVLRDLCGDRPARAAGRISRMRYPSAKGLSRLGHAGLRRVLHEVERQDLWSDARRRYPRPPLPQVALRRSGRCRRNTPPVSSATCWFRRPGRSSSIARSSSPRSCRARASTAPRWSSIRPTSAGASG